MENLERTDIFPGKYLIKKGRNSGFSIIYHSFRHKIDVYYCWISTYEAALEEVQKLNGQRLTEIMSGDLKMEKEIKKLAEKIKNTKKK